MEDSIQQRMNDKEKWYADAANYWEVCMYQDSYSFKITLKLNFSSFFLYRITCPYFKVLYLYTL